MSERGAGERAFLAWHDRFVEQDLADAKSVDTYGVTERTIRDAQLRAYEDFRATQRAGRVATGSLRDDMLTTRLGQQAAQHDAMHDPFAKVRQAEADQRLADARREVHERRDADVVRHANARQAELAEEASQAIRHIFSDDFAAQTFGRRAEPEPQPEPQPEPSLDPEPGA